MTKTYKGPRETPKSTPKQLNSNKGVEQLKETTKIQIEKLIGPFEQRKEDYCLPCDVGSPCGDMCDSKFRDLNPEKFKEEQEVLRILNNIEYIEKAYIEASNNLPFKKSITCGVEMSKKTFLQLLEEKNIMYDIKEEETEGQLKKIANKLIKKENKSKNIFIEIPSLNKTFEYDFKRDTVKFTGYKKCSTHIDIENKQIILKTPLNLCDVSLELPQDIDEKSIQEYAIFSENKGKYLFKNPYTKTKYRTGFEDDCFIQWGGVNDYTSSKAALKDMKENQPGGGLYKVMDAVTIFAGSKYYLNGIYLHQLEKEYKGVLEHKIR